MSYFKQRKQDVYVTYVLENKEEKNEQVRRACYADMFNKVDKKWESVLLRENMDRVGYDEPEIKRWVDDLNEMGFPCQLEGVDETVRIRLTFGEFKSKAHLCSTLSLLRLLWENGLDKIPEAYFGMVDADPNIDKIDALQTAHKNLNAGMGHAVTGPYNGKANVEKKLLLERLSQGIGIHAMREGYRLVNETWRSPEAKQAKGYGGYFE